MSPRFGAAGLAMLLAACSAGQYPMPDEPPNAWVHAPAAVGDPSGIVVVYLTPRPGDEIELLGAEAVGVVEGASVEFFLSPTIRDGDDYVVGEQREQLVGGRFSAPEGESPAPDATVGIIAELTASQPGRYVLSSMRLRFRINGGPERVAEGIDVVLVVCADDPAPAECEDLESG